MDPGSLLVAWPYWLPAIAGGYLLGSIPFGLALTRLAGLGDVRAIGSGNIGATNVLRTGRKGLAAATLLLDVGKGLLATLLAGLLGAPAGLPEPPLLAGVAAVLGHMFPVWLKFRGGKGAATALGVLLAISWPAGLIAAATWLLTAFLFRYSSLAALVSTAAAPGYTLLFSGAAAASVIGVIAALIWLRHYRNIQRLVGGREPKIGARSDADDGRDPKAV